MAFVLLYFAGYGAGDLFSKKPQFSPAIYFILVFSLVFSFALMVTGLPNLNFAINSDDPIMIISCIITFVVAFGLGNARAKEDEDKNSSGQSK